MRVFLRKVPWGVTARFRSFKCPCVDLLFFFSRGCFYYYFCYFSFLFFFSSLLFSVFFFFCGVASRFDHKATTVIIKRQQTTAIKNREMQPAARFLYSRQAWTTMRVFFYFRFFFLSKIKLEVLLLSLMCMALSDVTHFPQLKSDDGV